MASDLRDQSAATEPSMTSLLTGIINDTQTLVKQEVALARREFKEELHKTVQAAFGFGVGAGLLALGGTFLMVTLALILSWALDWPAWAGFAIIGVLLALVGGGLLLYGKSRAEEVHLVPPQTAETLKENAQWLKNQT
jgi:uncharacterized membrane protein YqjE